MKTYLQRWFFKVIGKTPAHMPMVQYWKRVSSVNAKVTYNKDGAVMMKMEGEDQPFPGFPRGYLLFGKLSKLKHEIKNQIFNCAWACLEAGDAEENIMANIEGPILQRIFDLAEDTKYDRVPFERMCKPVRELYRAWSIVAPDSKLRDIVCFIFQEDDSYRFRFQWLTTYFKPNRLAQRFSNPIPRFEHSLQMLEHAEVISDMKERIRLVRRVLMMWIRHNPKSFVRFVREVDWNKIKLSEADKFHFRGKYFKVDFDLFEY